MPASGGSLSDTNVSTNKVVDGQSHYLAYITPDEGKSLVDQGGKETITDSGIPAYPPPTGTAEEASAYSGVAMGGEAGSGSDQGGHHPPSQPEPSLPPQLGGPSTVEQAEQFRDEGGNKENIIENINQNLKKGLITVDEALKIGKTYNLVKNSSFINMLSSAGGAAIAFAGGLGKEAQSKAITWDLNRKLTAVGKQKDFHPGSHSMQIQDLQDKIERANLPKDDPNHYGQDDWTKDYGKNLSAPDDGGGNARGLTNVITPYAAHAIGGTTQQPSIAAQWYANLGSGNTNPGAFNLTQQYAAAKAAVSQRLQSTSSVGQIAVADSAFFNFLKDNSLNKGIL